MSLDQPGYIEQMLDILTGQIADLQGMAAIAAAGPSARAPLKARNTPRRISVKRS
jgi:hypothetical protein